MAAIGHPLDATAGPVITNFPIWLAETQRIPSLALPDEPPRDVLDLAHDPVQFATGRPPRAGEHGIWPADLAAGRRGCLVLPRAGPGPGREPGLARSARRRREHSRSSAHEDRPLYSESDGASTRRDRCTGQPLRRTPRGGEGGGRLQREHAQERARALSRGLLRSARRSGRRCATSSTPTTARRSTACGTRPARPPSIRAADAAEAGADDARRRALRGDVDSSPTDLGEHQAELAKLELAERTLERTWLFLERGDATLLTEVGGPATAGDIQMRIVEAQEAERSRLAQEIHDGPAQALSNTIFQVEYIERVIDPTRCSPGPSCATCASCSAASSATSGRSSASSGRRCSTSSASTAPSSTRSSTCGR